MKYLRLALLIPLILLIQPANAQGDYMISTDMQNYIGYGAIITMLLLFLVVLLILLRTFKILTRVILKLQGYTEQQITAELKPVKEPNRPKAQVWNKLLSLRPLSEEKELL